MDFFDASLIFTILMSGVVKVNGNVFFPNNNLISLGKIKNIVVIEVNTLLFGKSMMLDHQGFF